MKNLTRKKMALLMMLGGAFMLGSQVNAMETTCPSEDDVLKLVIEKLPSDFDPEKATLEDFQDGNQIEDFKLTKVAEGRNIKNDLLQPKPVRFQPTLSKDKSCVYFVHYQAKVRMHNHADVWLFFEQEKK